jgi:hypothetical protein
MRTNYTIKDVELIQQEAYKTGLEFGELQARDRIIELLRSEEELAAGFSQRNALIHDLIELIREEI